MKPPRSVQDVQDDIQEQLTPPLEIANKKALDLFLELYDSLGEAQARQIFARWGTPPSKRRMQEIEAMGIIHRLDHMIKTDRSGEHCRDPDGMLIFEPNVKRLARDIAAEALDNPSPGEIATIERYIQKLNARRKKNPHRWPRRPKGTGKV